MKKGLFFLIPALYLYFSPIIAVTYNSEPKIFVQELIDDAMECNYDEKTDTYTGTETVVEITKLPGFKYYFMQKGQYKNLIMMLLRK